MSQSPDNRDNTQSLRVDRWLWAARFFRTRSLAAAAVRRGRVTVNGERAKPARAVRVGDRVGAMRGATPLEVEVTAVSARRGDATAAALLYAETEASVQRRARESEQHRLAAKIRPARRPDKKARRELRRLNREQDS